MEDQQKKKQDNEELLKEEAERKQKLEEAKKELGAVDKPRHKKKGIDEQDSDGSASAFRNK
jgi:hypothetical protein